MNHVRADWGERHQGSCSPILLVILLLLLLAVVPPPSSLSMLRPIKPEQKPFSFIPASFAMLIALHKMSSTGAIPGMCESFFAEPRPVVGLALIDKTLSSPKATPFREGGIWITGDRGPTLEEKAFQAKRK